MGPGEEERERMNPGRREKKEARDCTRASGKEEEEEDDEKVIYRSGGNTIETEVSVRFFFVLFFFSFLKSRAEKKETHTHWLRRSSFVFHF